MDMLNVHAAALANGKIAYHEFLLCYRAGQKLVYGMVEGKDDPCFYRGIIDQILPQGWRLGSLGPGASGRFSQH
jgi:hypothetical protein